jgi:hypothetical protein
MFSCHQHLVEWENAFQGKLPPNRAEPPLAPRYGLPKISLAGSIRSLITS